MAAWPPLPRIVTWNSLLDASTGPGDEAKHPTGMPGILCMPNTASIGNFWNRPSRIISRAPPPRSSAGWKIRYTVPSKFRWRARCCAAPSSMAVWPSWPQACMTPACLLAWLNWFTSCIGSASMSARSPSVRGELPLRITPTSPVLPNPRCTGMSQLSSSSATSCEVRFSSNASSGCAWMSLRISRMDEECSTMSSIRFICLHGLRGRSREFRVGWIEFSRA
ncbi:hypothetical protein D3C87_1335230 [compost metagenome]